MRIVYCIVTKAKEFNRKKIKFKKSWAMPFGLDKPIKLKSSTNIIILVKSLLCDSNPNLLGVLLLFF